MLHITRHEGGAIRIGDDVVIEVLNVTGTTVRLGITAPQSVPIYREELWQAISAENQASAQHGAETAPADIATAVDARASRGRSQRRVIGEQREPVAAGER
ncbi:MAG TPA: carbon storage regulator [Solirubrobacteraceae bacterium]|nr:carbon storage regulator [Solirubrobacteraceae bacterium]